MLFWHINVCHNVHVRYIPWLLWHISAFWLPYEGKKEVFPHKTWTADLFVFALLVEVEKHPYPKVVFAWLILLEVIAINSEPKESKLHKFNCTAVSINILSLARSSLCLRQLWNTAHSSVKTYVCISVQYIYIQISEVIFAPCAFMVIHLNCERFRLQFRFHLYFPCIKGDSLGCVFSVQQWICIVDGIAAVFILHNLSSGELHAWVLHLR